MTARAWLCRMSFCLVFGPLSLTSSTFAQDPKARPNIAVSASKSICPTARYSSIQQAVNAASPGELIEVCAGTYNEQVTIEKNIRIHGDDGAILQPNPMTANGTGIVSGEPVAAAILAQNAAEVAIEGLIVDGAFNAITACSPTLYGILFQNASGVIRHNAVKHMRLTAVAAGCQSGNAIAVESQGASSQVDISANSVHGYQKNGITANESGTSVNIEGNTATAPAPATSSDAAPNGIQIGFGATGSIVGNNVADHIWTPCVSVANCSANGTGILIFESDGVTITENTVAVNQIGIAVIGNGASIIGNNVFDSKVLWGVVLQGNNNVAESNRITHSSDAGIFVQGNDDTIQQNQISDAGVGIQKAAGSTGNAIAGNTFFDIAGQLVQDPAGSPSLPVQPMR
jgi:parallel beta-helix repeat protein